MADYIDRQAAINALVEELAYKPEGYWDSGLNQYDVEVVLNQQPPVDAVKVVRCKDCKYFDSGTDEDGKLFFKCLGWVYGGTSEDDFCSHGERK